MSPEQIVERERRLALPTAIVTVVGVVLAIGSVVAKQAVLSGRTDAVVLRSVHGHETVLVLLAITFGIGVALLSVELAYLFRAAAARSEAVRRPLIGFAFIGPALLGIQSVVAAIATNQVSKDFIAHHVGPGKTAETLADKLIHDSTLTSTAASLLIPAILGMLIALVYIPLHAIRNGLLTRFWGTLAMAFGVSLIILPPVALIGIMLWSVYFAFLIAGWSRAERPPAWAAGVSIPWPKPGEQNVAAAIPGSATEVRGNGGDDRAENGDGAGNGDGAKREQRRAASRKRKRKRRK